MQIKNTTKSSFPRYFPACDGVLKKPLPCLLAARDGAKPSIFWMFWKTMFFITFFNTALSVHSMMV